MNYFMNGEIYLKREPEIFNSKENLESVNDKIHDLEFESSKENPDLKSLNVLEDYQKLASKIKGWNGQLDYTGTSDFWQAYIMEDGKINVSFVDLYYREERVFSDLVEVEKYFVKLTDFLDKAIYVGREFRRTKPAFVYGSSTGDKSYMDNSEFRVIVLYATQDLFLCYRISKHHDNQYVLLNSMYTVDGNYEFLGDVQEEYSDKGKVYREILEQISRDREKYNEFSKGI